MTSSGIIYHKRSSTEKLKKSEKPEILWIIKINLIVISIYLRNACRFHSIEHTKPWYITEQVANVELPNYKVMFVQQ